MNPLTTEILRRTNDAGELADATIAFDKTTHMHFRGRKAGFNYALKHGFAGVREKQFQANRESARQWTTGEDFWRFHYADGMAAALAEVMALIAKHTGFAPTAIAEVIGRRGGRTHD